MKLLWQALKDFFPWQNLASETIRARQKRNARASETTTRAPETKTCESETKPCASENKLCASKTKICAAMLHGIVPSNYLHEGSNPPPPLTTMLNRMLPSTYLREGSSPPPPLDHYVDWDITFSLSLWGMKSATPFDHYVEWVEKDFAACSSGHCIAYKIQSHTLAILAILLFQFCARDYVAVSIRVFCFRLQVGFRASEAPVLVSHAPFLVSDSPVLVSDSRVLVSDSQLGVFLRCDEVHHIIEGSWVSEFSSKLGRSSHCRIFSPWTWILGVCLR